MPEQINVDLDALLSELDLTAKDEFASKPIVEEWTEGFDVSNLPIEARRWVKVPDLVAVVADLRNSTHLGTGKHAASTASIYQAATGGVVSTYNRFGADFIAIQGDGAFALFWGERRYERAICAGVTVKTFSERHLIPRLEAKWTAHAEEHPTGFKVGVASGRALVKRVGTPRNLSEQEPVWAGTPVNFATKAAQQADRHELIVTGSVWDRIEKNDFLSLTCPCGDGPHSTLWDDVTVEKIPEANAERQGRLLRSSWCAIHGEEYVAAILGGETKREDAQNARSALQKALFSNALQLTASQKRKNLRDRRQGLR
ncbi:adenylate/guanylate cyclase domain-containing protein [Curtobacterium sp. MCJR17_020]|uniref:adenylate/guanylate cyclase domain-containing protein n=1 Tax=Curtobacterium sp. MCJR17_020 TaxID=2175619 RepID=UPI0011B6F72F|nr:adenylate/guanylate cyclase domain-containing protein [Curtobacterium sp. MCJR17_020]WIE74129.1 adenylate/guanylate cyclase domain-containing protein [Curtobacterium sp. MCJR17_020]